MEPRQSRPGSICPQWRDPAYGPGRPHFRIKIKDKRVVSRSADGIRRPRAQVQQSSREPPTAVSRVPPPPHVRILAKFIRLLPLASYCVDATERRASAAPKATEIHKTRNPRPFTGFFFGLYMHPNRLLDLKIVFNQHPKPLNGITNVFCIGGRSGPVNFLFS